MVNEEGAAPLEPGFARADDARDADEEERQPKPEGPEVGHPLEVENHQHGGPRHKSQTDQTQSRRSHLFTAFLAQFQPEPSAESCADCSPQASP